MGETLALAGLLTTLVGLMSWLIRSVIGEYHRRLDRHDEFMDTVIRENNETMKEVAQKNGETALVMQEVSASVRANTAVALSCRHVVDAQMQELILASQRAQKRREPLSP